MSHFEITELNRRLANMITLGTVAETDYKTAKVRVQIGELLSGWLPWLTARASNDVNWWAPEVGEQVVVIAPSGDLAQGIVLTALYKDQYPPPADHPNVHTTHYDGGADRGGATIEYDREKKHLKALLPNGGNAKLVANDGTIELMA